MSKKRKRMVNTDYEREMQNEKGFHSLYNIAATRKIWTRMDPKQRHYASSIGKSLVTMVNACSGSGKTSIAVMRGFELLKEGKVDRIQYVRLPDARGQGQGYLPGDEQEKAKGYFRPFFEACKELELRTEDILNLIGNEVIELCTDMFLRGSTLGRTYVILDEAQNGNIKDLRLVLTRIKDNGFAVVIGHSEQVDNKVPTYGRDKLIPFEVFQLHMGKESFTTNCELIHDYRGAISRWADRIMETVEELETQEKQVI